MRVPQCREPAADVGAGTRLDGATRSLLGQADTAFVATRAPEHGADVAHRGGNPGFLRVVDDTTIVWPDYQGNAMFNTLGNLQLDPSCGLTVVSPDDGTTLHLSGRGEVLWDLDDLPAFPGAQRVVALHVQASVRLDHAAPLRWRLERPARNPPLT
jgi:predicted pyridoxine 5'-phosphate oxidase superfamily flavin-nucleotide-binding protein